MEYCVVGKDGIISVENHKLVEFVDSYDGFDWVVSHGLHLGIVDTLLLCRTYFPNLKNFDLDTICDVFGFDRHKKDCEIVFMLYEMILDYQKEKAWIQNSNICITGRLEKMTRGVAYDHIVRLGGFVQTSVNSKTDYLIVAKLKQPSRKLSLALSNDIVIMCEDDFYRQLSCQL